MAKTPEGRCKDEIKKQTPLLLPNSLFYMPVQSGYGRSGVSDFIGCVPLTITQAAVGQTFGLFVANEAKSSIGNPTTLQADFLMEVINAGGEGIVTRGKRNVVSTLTGLREALIAKGLIPQG